MARNVSQFCGYAVIMFFEYPRYRRLLLPKLKFLRCNTGFPHDTSVRPKIPIRLHPKPRVDFSFQSYSKPLGYSTPKHEPHAIHTTRIEALKLYTLKRKPALPIALQFTASSL